MNNDLDIKSKPGVTSTRLTNYSDISGRTCSPIFIIHGEDNTRRIESLAAAYRFILSEAWGTK